MSDCLECAHLREECALAFAEYQSCKDELALTRKSEKEFTGRRRALERAEGRLRECRAREAHHRDEFHAGNVLRGTLLEDAAIEPRGTSQNLYLFARLLLAFYWLILAESCILPRVRWRLGGYVQLHQLASMPSNLVEHTQMMTKISP